MTHRADDHLDRTGLRRTRFHDLLHSTATLLLEQGANSSSSSIRLQRNAIDTLSTALDGPAGYEPTRDDGNDPPLCGATVR